MNNNKESIAMKLMSSEEYEQKVKNIKNQNDLANFARELFGPLLKKNTKTNLALVPATPVLGGSEDLALLSENSLENQVITLYAKGLTTTDISNYLKQTQGLDISSSRISDITDKVLPLIKEWENRPLSSQYPIVYLDGLHFKVRDSGKVVSKCAYIALGVNGEGRKEVLGIWIAESEGAKLWLQKLGELKHRGVESILITCVDGLKGFSDAIKTIYPESEIQVCVVHQIRHTIKFIPHKDRPQFADDLKAVYGAATEQSGLQALEDMRKKWPKYDFYLKRWQDRWGELSPFFSYPEAIRRVMYTTNTIENLNRQLRKVTKTTQVFPHDEALLKLLWLAQADLSRKWVMSEKNWGEILAQLAILFPEKMRV